MSTWHDGFKVLRQSSQFGIYLEVYKGYKLIFTKVVSTIEEANRVEEEVYQIEKLAHGGL